MEAEIKKEHDGGKEYLGGGEVEKKHKKNNFHIVNKGPGSLHHEIYRPALLLVSSPCHDCLLTWGGKQIFVEDMRRQTGAKDRNCEHNEFHTPVIDSSYHAGWGMNLWATVSFVYFQTDPGRFPAGDRVGRQFSSETVLFGEAPL